MAIAVKKAPAAKLVAGGKQKKPRKKKVCKYGYHRADNLLRHTEQVIALLKSGQAKTLDECAALLGNCTGAALRVRDRKYGCFSPYLYQKVLEAAPVLPVTKKKRAYRKKKKSLWRRFINWLNN